MGTFRQENKLLIFIALTFGLYMKSLECLTSNRWIIGFYTVWTKIPTVLLYIYIGLDVRALLTQEMPMVEWFGMIRKISAYTSFISKNLLFYWNRDKIEKLIDLWDDSFVEKFYSERDLVCKRKNYKKNKKILTAYTTLAVAAAFSYALPSLRSKEKKILHPSGIDAPKSSPEFELVVIFDLFCSLSGITSGAFDCLLVVLLSYVRYKLVFLREVLTDIVNEVIIDDEGRLLGRRTTRSDGMSDLERYGEGGKGEEYYEEIGGEELKRHVGVIDEKLRIWILHHQQAIRFFEEIAKVYSSLATMELGNNVFYTALTALNIVQLKLNIGILGILLVAACNNTSLFLWCKIAGDLMDVDTFSDVFSRPWFLLPKKLKTAFSFIIMRTKKPLCLFGFSIFAINLATFYDIMKLTYQFFTFMVHVTSQQEKLKEEGTH